ncbi:MAG: hypothetical protein AAB225_20690 [Acidobacteriota bacterium]
MLGLSLVGGSYSAVLADSGKGGGNSGSTNSGSGKGNNDDRSGNSGSSNSGSSKGHNDDRGGNSGPGSQNSGNPERVRQEARAEADFEGFEAELHVRFEKREDRTRLTAEVENVNLPAGTLLNVCLGGQTLGHIVLNAFHSGELELDSRNGHFVPSIGSADLIEVKQTACAFPAAPILAVSIGGGTAPAAGGQRVRLEGRRQAVINGFQAEFKARFEHRADRMRFNAEVEDLNVAERTALNVCFGAMRLGGIVLDGSHEGELELDSRDGDAVPMLKSGDIIALKLGPCTTGAVLIWTELR